MSVHENDDEPVRDNLPAVVFPAASERPPSDAFKSLRRQENTYGQRPVLTVKFRLQSDTRKECELQYGCNFNSTSVGPEPAQAKRLCALAYLEYHCLEHAHFPEMSILACGSMLLWDLRMQIHGHILHSGFVSQDTVPAHVCQCGNTNVLDCTKPADIAWFGTSLGRYTPNAVYAILSQTAKGAGYALWPKNPNLAGAVDAKSDGPLNYYRPQPGVVVWTTPEQTFATLDPTYLQDGMLVITNPEDGSELLMRCTPIGTASLDYQAYYLQTWYQPSEPEYRMTSFEVKKPDESVLWETQEGNTSATHSIVTNGSLRPTAAVWAVAEVDEILYAGPYICFVRKTQQRVMFDRRIAFKGLREFMHKARDETCLRSITRWVNGQYGALAALPEEHKYKAQAATVLYILVRIGYETDLLITHVRKAGPLWQQHKDLTGLRSPSVWDREKVIGTLVFTGATGYVAHCGDVATQHMMAVGGGVKLSVPSSYMMIKHVIIAKLAVAQTVTTAAAVTGTALSFPVALSVWALSCAGYMAYRHVRDHSQRADVVKAWAETDMDRAPPCIPDGVYELSKEYRFGPTSVVKSTIPEQDETAAIIAPSEPVLKPPTTKVVAAGLCFQKPPTYFENTAENQIVALLNRTTIATPSPKKDLWAAVVQEMLQLPAYRAVTHRLAEPEHHFRCTRRVVSKYLERFPKGLQLERLEAFDQWVRNGREFTREDYFAGGFLKGELHSKLEFSECGFETGYLEEGTPRAIISFSPVLNAVFGPFVDHFASNEKAVLKTLLEAGDTPAFCPYGVSVETHALWIEQVVERLGGPEEVVWLRFDGKKHDAHNTKEARQGGRALTVGRVIGDDSRKLLKDIANMDTLRGQTAGGVKFKAGKGIRASGESSTSSDNTKQTESIIAYTMTRELNQITSVMGVDVFGMAAGDDGGALVSKSYWNRRFAGINKPFDDINRKAVDLGFELVGGFGIGDPDDFDFCSKWYYPVSGTFLPGAKIGKSLVKAGYFFDAQGSQTVKSAAIGLFQDNAHVPFLREYYARVIELCRADPKRFKLGGRPNEYTIHASRAHDYDESTLRFVERKYGLTKQDLEDFKAILRSVRSLPTLISWAPLERCLAVDSA